MKTRKIFAIILTIVMAVSMLSISAFAAGEPTFRGEEVKAKAGDTVTYKVYIDNNPGIAGFKVQVDFSEDAFQLVSQKEDNYKNVYTVRRGDFTEDGNLVSNTTEYGCTALWFNVENVKTDGVAFTVKFKVSKDAVNGEHAVKIRCDATNTCDIDGKLVSFKTVDGSITVSKGKEGTINNDEVGPSAAELKQIEAGTLSPSGYPVEETETEEPKVITGDQSKINEATEKATEGNEFVTDDDVPTAKEEIDSVESSSPSGNAKDNKTLKIILGAVAAAVVAAVAIVFGVASKNKKASRAVAEGEAAELGIDEVMGWSDDADSSDVDDDDLDN